MLLSSIQVKVLRRAARLDIRTAARIYGTTITEWKAWEADEQPIPMDVFQMLEEAAGGVEPLKLDFDSTSL